MLGAIYGDEAGSIYEYEQLKSIKPVNPSLLITEKSFYSDDTIETIAIADAILNQKDYDETLRSYILKYLDYKPSYEPYFEQAFSPGTIRWVKGLGTGDSIGNGAMMRISPVGYLFDNEADIIHNVQLATIPSHNSKESIDSATIIALMIFYFRNGMDKEFVYKKLNLPIKYEPFVRFNKTCSETLINCLYVIYNSTSFEDAIRQTLLMGGDTDTNACIVGAVTEALYGLSQKEQEEALQNLPHEFKLVLKKAYQKSS